MISAVIELADESIIIHKEAVKTVSTKFKCGFYEAHTDHNGNLIIKRHKINELHEPFKSKENKQMIDTVNSFFKTEIKTKVNQLGFTHKLGILLYGIAGTGKTSLMTYIANHLIENNNAITFFCNNDNTLMSAVKVATGIRKIQDNPIVFILDEFDTFAMSDENVIKNLLDGKDSVENSLCLASTNYIERIPDTLKKRPSRFRLVLEINGITDKDAMYSVTEKISNKIAPNLFTKEEIIQLYSNKTSVTVDEIKHICLNKLTGSYIKVKTKNPIGFNNKSQEDELTLNWVSLEQVKDTGNSNRTRKQDWE